MDSRYVEVEDIQVDDQYFKAFIDRWCIVSRPNGMLWARVARTDKYGVWLMDFKGGMIYIKFGDKDQYIVRCKGKPSVLVTIKKGCVDCEDGYE